MSINKPEIAASEKIQAPTAAQNSDTLRIFPAAWRPYVELTRMHKAAGLMCFTFPYLIGLLFATSALSPSSSASPKNIVGLGCFLFFDSFLLRSYACVWNDNVDQDLDRKVARCRNRPIARGAVSTTGATIFTVVLVALRLFLLQYLLSTRCAIHGLVTTALVVIYPYLKRVSNYPQLWLGFAIAGAIPLTCAAIEDVLRNGSLATSSPSTGGVLALSLAHVCWTVIYDTVYGFQDLQDDLKAGVKSMAVRFRKSPKALFFSVALVQTALLFLSGVDAGLKLPFFVGSVGSTVGLLYMLVAVDLRDPSSCRWFFASGQWIVGGPLAAALLADLFC